MGTVQPEGISQFCIITVKNVLRGSPGRLSTRHAVPKTAHTEPPSIPGISVPAALGEGASLNLLAVTYPRGLYWARKLNPSVQGCGPDPIYAAPAYEASLFLKPESGHWKACREIISLCIPLSERRTQKFATNRNRPKICAYTLQRGSYLSLFLATESVYLSTADSNCPTSGCHFAVHSRCAQSRS